MNVKKFIAPTAREALRKLRDALGADSIIISNRTVNGQVEILALAEGDMASLSAPASDVIAPPKAANRFFPSGRSGTAAKTGSPETGRSAFAATSSTPVAPRASASTSALGASASFSSRNPGGMTSVYEEQADGGARVQSFSQQKPLATGTQRAAQAPSQHPASLPAGGFDQAVPAHMSPRVAPAMAPATLAAASAVAPKTSAAAAAYPSIHVPQAPGTAELMQELRSMRGMMEAQLSEITWGQTQRKEPYKAALLRQMLAAGFSVSLSRYLIENLPATMSASAEQALVWIKAMMARNLLSLGSESDMLEQGGVFALVGPTGVGKTTTTAKLAARCVMRHGANKLGLITTDGYRIGGYEQLRIYGKILGVMVHAVKDQADLQIALAELKNKHTVLIDTVGMSQRDRLVSEQVAMLSGSNVKRLLCLNATSTGETLSEVVHSYKGTGLAGCIVTKLDEAASIGSVLDSVMRQKLTMYYVANGQRVPEDLHVANKQYLVDLAFKMKRETPNWQHYQDDELPMLMAGASASMHDRQLREVSLG